MRKGSAVVCTIWLLAVMDVARGAPVVIRDRTFAGADWSITTFVAGNGGLVEGTQTAAGNPSPGRRVRTVVNPSPSPTLRAQPIRPAAVKGDPFADLAQIFDESRHRRRRGRQARSQARTIDVADDQDTSVEISRVTTTGSAGFTRW